MAKKRTTWLTPEEQAEYDERTRFLQERIAYHRAKIEEARVKRERRAQRWAWLRRLVHPA